MNLAQAFRLVYPNIRTGFQQAAAPDLHRDAPVVLERSELPTCVALVGAGGKTTALFELARQLPPPVFITTTTHLATWQLALADEHLILSTQDDLRLLSRLDLTGVMLITGVLVDQDRVSGLETHLLRGLHELVRSRGKFLLIEADGSRQRPLKSPAEHEPLIPDFVDLVVVVAGLSGLGQPLTEEWVHRPALFAELAGLGLGDPVTPESLVRMLIHPQGGLKAVPPSVRRVALLNQADSSLLQAQAQHLASSLLPAYHSVVVSSLQDPGFATSEVRERRLDTSDEVNLEGLRVHAVYEPTAGVILAAGGASRIGMPKQLLLYRSRPLVWHVASAALAAGLSPVYVVLGAFEPQVRSALGGLPVAFVHNTAWESGQSSSMKAGLLALPKQTGAVIFLLADQPKVPLGLLKTLVEQHALTLAPILAPLIDGQRANPVLFDRLTFEDLMRVQGDVGGRAIFSAYPVTWIDWYDPGAGMDVDTEADYQRLIDSDQ